jgi:hypothetical protein
LPREVVGRRRRKRGWAAGGVHSRANATEEREREK